MRFGKISTLIQSSAIVTILCGAALAADAPSTQPSTAPSTQAATTQPGGTLLTSWEGSLDGWYVFADNTAGGEPEANGTSFSKTTGVTDGKQSLALNMKSGFRKALRVDDVALAGKLKGHKLSLDITAPASAAPGSFLQIAVSAVAEGMPWSMTGIKPIEMDGKPHTLILDTSKWHIPDHPQYFGLFIITNTGGDAQTGTIYLDNLRILD
jgi:hypothetical protein